MVASNAGATIFLSYIVIPDLPCEAMGIYLICHCAEGNARCGNIKNYLAFLSARYTPVKISTVPTIASDVILSSSTAHAVIIATIGLM